jgi:tetratricopeptide (TPR) repeat protein
MGLFDFLSEQPRLNTRISTALSKYYPIKNYEYKNGMKLVAKSQEKIISLLEKDEELLLLIPCANHLRGGINVFTTKRIMIINKPIRLPDQTIIYSDIGSVMSFVNQEQALYGLHCISKKAQENSDFIHDRNDSNLYWDNVVVISAPTPAIAIDAINAIQRVNDTSLQDNSIRASLRVAYANFINKYSGYILELYDEAIKNDQQNADAFFNRGRAYHIAGRNDEAMSDYNTSIELYPSYAEAYYWRGLLWGQLDNNEKKLVDYKKAVSLNPKNKHYQESLALVKSEAKNK